MKLEPGFRVHDMTSTTPTY